MIIVLNGPLGIGKSSLAEALSESIDFCVSLDGDSVVAANPEPETLEHLHSTLALLINHHRSFGYQHFVINHLWRSAEEFADLHSRLAAIDPEIHFFRLTLPVEENLRRIQLRASIRALDEDAFEQQTFAAEYALLNAGTGLELGEPLDVSAKLPSLVAEILRRLGET